MSKSDLNALACINLTDSDKEIAGKIKKAVTDSEKGVKYDLETRAGTSNLLNIYSGISGLGMDKLEVKFSETNKGAFKKDLTELLIGHIGPIREEINRINADQ